MTQKIKVGSAAWWDFVFLGLLLVAMSSQINLGDIGRDTYATEGYSTKTLKIALPDIALVLNMGWFALRTTMARGWKRLWWPPLPVWALMFAMMVALVHSPSVWGKLAEFFADKEIAAPTWKQQLGAVRADKGAFQALKEGIAETIQFGLYFGVAPLILANLLFDRREAGAWVDRREFALRAFAVGAILMIVLALLQMMRVGRAAPQALFGSANAFGAWFAIALPLLFAWSQSEGVNSKLRRLALPVAAGGVLVVSSLWAHLALLGGLLAMVVLAQGVRRVRLAVLAGLLALFVGVLWAQAPREERREPFTRIAGPREKVKKQFLEWYAWTGAAQPRQRAFASGVGPGNYQGNIGTYYSSLPNNAEQNEKMPPDSNNLFLVQAVSIGVLGLSALLWVVGHFARRADDARKYLQARSLDAWLPLGVLGSLASWMLVNAFHASIVRGTGLVLAFLFALSAVALASRDESDVAREVGEVEANARATSGV